jgi:hypothetical protein
MDQENVSATLTVAVPAAKVFAACDGLTASPGPFGRFESK